MRAIIDLVEAIGLRAVFVPSPADIAEVRDGVVFIDEISPRCEATDAVLRALADEGRAGRLRWGPETILR